MSSAADHAQRPRFLTGRDARFQPASKATAPTICYDYSRVDRLHRFGVSVWGSDARAKDGEGVALAMELPSPEPPTFNSLMAYAPGSLSLIVTYSSIPVVAVMAYTPFYDVFPDVAKAETRCLFVFEDPALPPDQYALTELYCNEPDCDCRRVFLQVYAEARKEFVAVVAFGWESIAFYRKWLHDDDPMALGDLKGPVLNLGSPQCEISAVVLDRVKAVLRDETYVDRLKRHYRLFKGTLGNAPNGTTGEGGYATNQPGRNQPCPCGSGLKYKYCCGR